MELLAVNIYYWGAIQQNRSLFDRIRFWSKELRYSGFISFRWYTFFDLRGTHAFILFGTTKRRELCSVLKKEISLFLKFEPSNASFKREQIWYHHQACAGKYLCASDLLDGVAPNNSFVLAPHDLHIYPLGFPFSAWGDSDFCKSIDALASWALNQSHPGRSALLWLSFLDKFIKKTQISNTEFWWFMLNCLKPEIPYVRREGMQSQIAKLRKAIGLENIQNFSHCISDLNRIKEELLDSEVLSFKLFDDKDATVRILREISHNVMFQLRLTTPQHIPLLCFMLLNALQNELAKN
jgi:hypothetical protein